MGAVRGHVEAAEAIGGDASVDVLNSSANDLVEVPNVPSKKEPINVSQEASTSSNPRRKSERIKRNVEVNYQEQTEKMIFAQEEESLEAVVVEKQQPRRPRRSVKKDATHAHCATKEKNDILEHDEEGEEGNSDDDDIKIDKIIVKNNTKNSSIMSCSGSGSKMAPIFFQRSNAKSGAKTSSSKT